MSNFEWNENTPFVSFEDFEGGDIIVFPQCPNCGKFIKHGGCATNGLGEVRLYGWMCHKCGEVEPGWTRV
jgi:uncharacterized OB-fold protein